eukprot:454915_1
MPTFVDGNAAAQYECVICLDVFEQAVQIGCNGGHVFCKKCIESCIRDRRITCPMCRSTCLSESMQRVPFLDRQVGGLVVKCRNHRISQEKASYLKSQSLPSTLSDQENTNSSNSSDTTNTASDTGNGLRRSKRLKDKKSQNITGKKRKRSRDDEDDTTQNKKRKGNNEELCTWTGPYSELDGHIKTCPLQLTKCKYCDVKMLRRDLPTHCDECPNFPLTCTKCAMGDIPRHLMSYHQWQVCPREVIRCPRECGVWVVRQALEWHMNNHCLEGYKDCMFRNMGCKCVRFKRKEQNEHYADGKCIQRHNAVLYKNLNALDKKVSNLEARNLDLQARNGQLEIEKEAMYKDITSLYRHVAAFKKENEVQQRVNQGLRSTVQLLTNKVFPHHVQRQPASVRLRR